MFVTGRTKAFVFGLVIVFVLVHEQTIRKMQVRYNDAYSEVHSLPGGGPQGSLVGLIEYFVQSNDNADSVDPDLRFKYVDDLSVLELILLTGILSEYNFKQHVASDVGIDEYYVAPENIQTQDTLDRISDWTNQNKMKLNVDKTN